MAEEKAIDNKATVTATLADLQQAVASLTSRISDLTKELGDIKDKEEKLYKQVNALSYELHREESDSKW